jgi:hypothetical protein
MRNARVTVMRPSILGVFALGLLTAPALADSHTSGGSGRLGQVSAGIGSASGGSSDHSGGSSTSSNTSYGSDFHCDNTAYWRDAYCRDAVETVVIVDAATGTPQVVPVQAPAQRSKVEVYAGAQKVHESDGSVSAEVSVVDRHFRVNGMLTHYFEERMDGGQLTMTMPALTVGFRFTDAPAWLEVGVVNSQTHGDPMGNSSITGPMIGTRLEQQVGGATVFGTAEAMFFENNIKAYGGRAGIRFGHLQASFRVLDFNVGPALYGPELGLRF